VLTYFLDALGLFIFTSSVMTAIAANNDILGPVIDDKYMQNSGRQK
jgi:hypothetical protein